VPGGYLIDRSPKVSVFIPAFNAAQHLPAVLDRFPSDLWPSILHVWIINDGSSDDTGECADRLADRNPRIKVVHFPWNRGYGKTVREGLRRCNGDDCDFAVCLHADGQYPPEVIPEFIEDMSRRGIDILQGSRIASGTALSGGMPLYKYIANRILTFFENIVFDLSMTDFHSGMLLYGKKALVSLPFEALSSSFDFDLEVIALAKSRGLRIAELPVPTRYAGEISHVNVLSYGLRVVRVMARFAAGRYRGL
jgi:glycosyltransferase involved in cell wall biosynthesis